MAQDLGFTVVSIDDGTGAEPVKGVRDITGRIMTVEQMEVVRQKQEEELAEVTTQYEQLRAGNPTVTTQLLGQHTDGLTRQLAMLGQQHTETNATLEKLTAGDAATTAEILEKIKEQLSYRVEMVTTARDRTVQALALMAPDTPTNTTEEPEATAVKTETTPTP